MEKVQDNLYYVDRILRLEQKQKELVAVVKWENFSYKDVTREKIDRLKENPSLRKDLERKEAEFKIKPFAKAIHHQLIKDVQNIRTKLYSNHINHNDTRMIQEKEIENEDQKKVQLHHEHRELTLYQKVLCNFQACQVMKKQIKAGLGNLDPKDYFKLNDLKDEAWKRTNRTRSRKELISQASIEQIKGILKVQNDFKFCIAFKNKIFTCTSEKVLELCPNLLLIYLTKLVSFIGKELKSEIERQEAILRAKRFKFKSIEMVRKMLNITQHMQNKARVVHFGLNDQDLHHNIELHKRSFLQQEELGDERSYRQNLSPKNKKDEKEKKDEYEVGLTMAEDLKTLYLNIKNDIVQTLKGDPIIPQRQKKRKRTPKVKSPQVITITSRSASRSRNKVINDDRSEISRDSSQRKRRGRARRSSESREKGRGRPRSRSRGRSQDMRRGSSLSVWQSSESQSSSKEILKRLLPSQQISQSPRKRFRRN